jgi:hypothetical protein
MPYHGMEMPLEQYPPCNKIVCITIRKGFHFHAQQFLKLLIIFRARDHANLTENSLFGTFVSIKWMNPIDEFYISTPLDSLGNYSDNGLMLCCGFYKKNLM